LQRKRRVSLYYCAEGFGERKGGGDAGVPVACAWPEKGKIVVVSVGEGEGKKEENNNRKSGGKEGKKNVREQQKKGQREKVHIHPHLTGSQHQTSSVQGGKRRRGVFDKI